MKKQSDVDKSALEEPVNNLELNSWRRGFTPQAEIWNGRMAMFAIAVCVFSLLIFRLIFVD